MAVFEKKIPRKVCIDDTETLTVTIENAQNVQGHTEYVIRVQRGFQPDKSWIVCKRYNDFVALHGLVQVSGICLSLPPKKLIGNMDKNFIAERKSALQNYLNIILMNPILASSLGVRKFLDPQNYVMSLQEQALQHVSMALRSEVNYELIKPIPEMGWRLRKHYFLVKSKMNPKSEMVLQWVEYGPDKYLEDKDLNSVLKCLVNLNHPHIEKLEFVHSGEGGSFVVRTLHPNGTLRDVICQAKPKTSFLKKYGNPKQVRLLQLHEVSNYGHQILEALVLLQEKGIPYGHLHLGNILLLDNSIRLLDIENGVLGLPSYYRPFFVQHKKINTMEAVDVYSFGHVLFEMAFGFPLHESVCDNLPSSCPAQLRAVLDLILSSESCKTGLPTLQELIQHPLFNSSYRNQSVRVNFKLPASLKESLKEAVQKTEGRLREEQKVVRHQKKIAKVQELLSSEEEMKKRKQRLKEERKANHRQHSLNSTSKSPPRSDSPTSTSTATSAGTVTPPLMGIKYPPPPCPINNPAPAGEGRSALLDSICAFNKSALRHQAPVNGSACS